MKKYLYPILYTVGIILIGTLISSILYYFNITSDKINTIFLYAISILALFIGSLKLAQKLKYKGLITGLIYFTCFLVISLILSLLIFKASFSFKNIIYYIVLLIFSLLGGVLGKNTSIEADIN